MCSHETACLSSSCYGMCCSITVYYNMKHIFSEAWPNGFQMRCVLQLSQLIQLCLGLWLLWGSRNSPFSWHGRMLFLHSANLQNPPNSYSMLQEALKWRHAAFQSTLRRILACWKLMTEAIRRGKSLACIGQTEALCRRSCMQYSRFCTWK